MSANAATTCERCYWPVALGHDGLRRDLDGSFHVCRLNEHGKPLPGAKTRTVAGGGTPATGRSGKAESVANTVIRVVGSAGSAVSAHAHKRLTAPELMSMELPAPKWVVPGLLPTGLAVLAGKPKLGKSWLVLALAQATAAGGRALGQIPVEGGEALYLALEDPPRRLQARLGKLLGPDQAVAGLTFQTSASRMDAGLLDELRSFLRDHPACRFVVIDTFARIRPRSRPNSDSYAEDYAVGTALKAVADEFDICLLLVTHQRKLQAVDWVDSITGTLGFVGAADTLMAIIRERGRADAVLHVTGRDVEDQELALTFDTTTAQWTLAGEAAEFRRSKERMEIIELLDHASGPLGPAHAAQALDKDRNAVKGLMRQMALDGDIRATGEGTYEPTNRANRTTRYPTTHEQGERDAPPGLTEAESAIYRAEQAKPPSERWRPMEKVV